MSAVGFDFGNQNLVVAIVQNGGVEVVANETSNRLSPYVSEHSPMTHKAVTW